MENETKSILDYAERRRLLTYAVVGWLYTCITHQHYGTPDKPDAPWLAELGETPLGWRFDAACRAAWAHLLTDEVAHAWAVEHLLPKANDFIRDCLLGLVVSKSLDGTAPPSDTKDDKTPTGGEVLEHCISVDGLVDDLDRYALGDYSVRVSLREGGAAALRAWADAYLDVRPMGPPLAPAR